MSSPRFPDRDLRLERLDGLRPGPLADAAHVGAPLAQARATRETLAAYRALIDAVFTAPGAGEWLTGLRLAVAAYLADKEVAPPVPVARDALRAAGPGEAGS